MSKRFELAKQYTEKYKSVLKPCRHCGNKDVRIVSDRSCFDSKHNYWSVVCSTPKCDCTGVFRSVKEAVRQWNLMQGKGDVNGKNNQS